MQWSNLKLNKCPKCNGDLTGDDRNSLIICSKQSCDFKIGEERMTEIVTQQNARSVKFREISEEENRNALNEL